MLLFSLDDTHKNKYICMFIFMLMLIFCVDFRPNWHETAGNNSSDFPFQMYALTHTHKELTQFMIIAFEEYQWNEKNSFKLLAKMFGNPSCHLVNWILNWPNQSPKNRFLSSFFFLPVAVFSFLLRRCLLILTFFLLCKKIKFNPSIRKVHILLFISIN